MAIQCAPCSGGFCVRCAKSGKAMTMAKRGNANVHVRDRSRQRRRGAKAARVQFPAPSLQCIQRATSHRKGSSNGTKRSSAQRRKGTRPFARRGEGGEADVHRGKQDARAGGQSLRGTARLAKSKQRASQPARIVKRRDRHPARSLDPLHACRTPARKHRSAATARIITTIRNSPWASSTNAGTTKTVSPTDRAIRASARTGARTSRKKHARDHASNAKEETPWQKIRTVDGAQAQSRTTTRAARRTPASEPARPAAAPAAEPAARSA